MTFLSLVVGTVFSLIELATDSFVTSIWWYKYATFDCPQAVKDNVDYDNCGVYRNALMQLATVSSVAFVAGKLAGCLVEYRVKAAANSHLSRLDFFLHWISLGMYEKFRRVGVARDAKQHGDHNAVINSTRELYSEKLVDVLPQSIILVLQVIEMFLMSVYAGTYFFDASARMIVTSVLLFLATSHGLAGFTTYCPQSAWMRASNDDDATVSGSCCSRWYRKCITWITGRQLWLAAYHFMSLFSTLMVYTFIALHLVAKLDGHSGYWTFAVMSARWVVQMAIWCAQSSGRRHSWWRSLLSIMVYIPWADYIDAASKWGLAFWRDLLCTTLFNVVGNAVLITRADNGAAGGLYKTDYNTVGVVFGVMHFFLTILCHALYFTGPSDVDYAESNKAGLRRDQGIFSMELTAAV